MTKKQELTCDEKMRASTLGSKKISSADSSCMWRRFSTRAMLPILNLNTGAELRLTRGCRYIRAALMLMREGMMTMGDT